MSKPMNIPEEARLTEEEINAITCPDPIAQMDVVDRADLKTEIDVARVRLVALRRTLLKAAYEKIERVALPLIEKREREEGYSVGFETGKEEAAIEFRHKIEGAEKRARERIIKEIEANADYCVEEPCDWTGRGGLMSVKPQRADFIKLDIQDWQALKSERG
jgi:hypothetical protein